MLYTSFFFLLSSLEYILPASKFIIGISDLSKWLGIMNKYRFSIIGISVISALLSALPLPSVAAEMKSSVVEPKVPPAEGVVRSSDPVPLTFGAQARLRPEVRNNTDYGGNRNYTLLRFRLSSTFRPSSKTTLFFQPQFSKAFGSPAYTGISPTANAFQQTSGVFFDTAMIVHQAYLDYRPFESLRMIGGRQILTYGDELLIGAALGWANVGRSFDAIKLIYKEGDAQTDLFWSRLVDTSTFTKAGNGSADFGGLYQSLNFGTYLKNFDPYVFYLSDTRATSSISLWTAGLRMKSSVSSIDYRAETTYQAGTVGVDAQSAFQEDLELGYTLHPQSKLRLGLNGFYATPQFNQLFPAAHKWIGVADVLGRRNLYGGAIRASVTPHTDWTVSLDLFQLYRVSLDHPLYVLNGLNSLGSARATSSSSVGTELDFNVIYKVSSDVTLSAGINTLFSSDYLVSNFGAINPVYSFVEIEARY